MANVTLSSFRKGALLQDVAREIGDNAQGFF